MRRTFAVRAASWLVGAGVLSLLAAPAFSQSTNNYLPMNNSTENAFIITGQTSSGNNGNMMYRCWPGDTLWGSTTLAAAAGGAFSGMDMNGWQFASDIVSPLQSWGVPIWYWTLDPGNTCLLSAAAGGGFPPTKANVVGSPNTIAAFFFYTSVPCTSPIAWWFAFTGSAFAGTGDGTATTSPPNLIAGWQDQNNTTSFAFSYTLGSGDETSAARSRSKWNANATGGAVQQPASRIEWAFEIASADPVVFPSRGTSDVGGAGGLTPLAGSTVEFHAVNTAQAASGTFPVFTANILYGGGTAAHVPGITVFGSHHPVNPDPLWIIMLGLPFAGAPYDALGNGFWRPISGWLPGGESNSPALPLTGGAVGLTLGCGYLTVNFATPPPLIPDSSQGSQFWVR